MHVKAKIAVLGKGFEFGDLEGGETMNSLFLWTNLAGAPLGSGS